MSFQNLKVSNFGTLVLLGIVVLSLVKCVHFVGCQEVNDYEEIDNPAVLPLITQVVYGQLSNLTAAVSHDISNRSSFCVKDP